MNNPYRTCETESLRIASPAPSSGWSVRRCASALLWALMGCLGGTGCAVSNRPMVAPWVGISPGPEWTLPTTFDGGTFFVEAFVGTVGPLRLMVDTGSSYLVLSSKAAERLRQAGSTRGPLKGIASTSAGIRPDMEVVEVMDLRLGDWRAPRTLAVLENLDLFEKVIGEPLDGITGMAMFTSGALVLDFPRREVRIDLRPDPPGDGSVAVACRYRMYVPMARLDVADRRYVAVVSSAYTGSFRLPLQGDHILRSPPVVSTAHVNLQGLSKGHHARLGTNVLWGGLTFAQPIVETLSDSDALIGSQVIQHFVVRVDQRSRKLWLKPGTNSVVEALPWRSLGLSLTGEERGLRVMAVIPNTDAARAGVKTGDIVTAIDNEPASAWTTSRLRILVYTRDSCSVELLQDGTVRTLKLKVATLVE